MGMIELTIDIAAQHQAAVFGQFDMFIHKLISSGISEKETRQSTNFKGFWSIDFRI